MPVRGRLSSMRGRPSLCSLAILSLLAFSAPLGTAARRRGLDEEDISGPIVIGDTIAEAPGPLAEVLAKANLTEKKTIAQIIDEALEQEFPEEKQEGIGKNYNETAKNADVSPSRCVRTVRRGPYGRI